MSNKLVSSLRALLIVGLLPLPALSAGPAKQQVRYRMILTHGVDDATRDQMMKCADALNELPNVVLSPDSADFIITVGLTMLSDQRVLSEWRVADAFDLELWAGHVRDEQREAFRRYAKDFQYVGARMSEARFVEGKDRTSWCDPLVLRTYTSIFVPYLKGTLSN